MNFCTKCKAELDTDLKFCTNCGIPVEANQQFGQKTSLERSSIIDKVVGGLHKGVATVGANSKALMEKTRVKTIIGNLESERKQLAEALGMSVYEKCIRKESLSDSVIENLLEKIHKCLGDITKYQTELRRIDDDVSMVTGATGKFGCACGHTNHQNMNFCEKCGRSL